MRRRRHRKSPTIELNLAAMLDMAFQLLTFFILTFRPAPIEGQLSMHLPPPVPLTSVKSQNRDPISGSGGELSGLESLELFIEADEQGEVSRIKMGLRPIIKGHLDQRNLSSLNQQLKSAFELHGGLFDRAQLIVDHSLRYEELMKIVDVCTHQQIAGGKTLDRISFVEMKKPDSQ